MAVATGGGLAGDARSLQALRSDAARDPKVAAKEAAKQFEALFMQELMKSMRAAQVGTALFDNDASRMGTEMLDAQMATSFAGRPGGLSDMIAKQLERQMGLQPGPIPKPDVKPLVMPPTAAESERASRGPRIPERAAAAFVQQHEQAAARRRACERHPGHLHARAGGARVRLGAARDAPRRWHADAQPVRHQGRRRLEGRGGRGDDHRIRRTASPGAWCSDSAPTPATPSRSPTTRALMKSQPRYQSVREAGGDARAFASGLQRAGYATDPVYADKLSGVIATAQRLRGGNA